MATEFERLYRSIFEHAFDGILVADDEGRLLDVNPRACELLRALRDELPRRPISFRAGTWGSSGTSRRASNPRRRFAGARSASPAPSGSTASGAGNGTSTRTRSPGRTNATVSLACPPAPAR
ncbi:PAS domain-containing protein [Polyangium fumosum]|uniref:PAS domain-containing protein n=1 Tax=Polyangium fumosum TaxID=889272 RepID=A0A4U1IJQ6_9BACT|nr:PAS domain-containing protein [Polyangium fumosum]